MIIFVCNNMLSGRRKYVNDILILYMGILFFVIFYCYFVT